MHEGVSLINKSILGIKHFWVPSINNILNDMSILIHLGLVVILLASSSFVFLLLVVLAALLSVLAHHVLLADLIEAFAHASVLLFVFFELLQLDEKDVFQRTSRRLCFFHGYNLGQNWIGWNGYYVYSSVSSVFVK